MAAWLCILPAPYLGTDREDGQSLDLTSLGHNVSQKLHTTQAHELKALTTDKQTKS